MQIKNLKISSFGVSSRPTVLQLSFCCSSQQSCLHQTQVHCVCRQADVRRVVKPFRSYYIHEKGLKRVDMFVDTLSFTLSVSQKGLFNVFTFKISAVSNWPETDFLVTMCS